MNFISILLFLKATNILKENRVTKQMRSGRYIILDVLCKVCQEVLGWFYEFAFDPAQREKEGKIVLEMAKLRGGDEKETIVENDRNFLLTSQGQLEVTKYGK